MSQKGRRYSLKSKEAKLILNQASERLRINLENIIGPKRNVEVAESELTRIFLIDGKPLLFKTGETVLPTLLFTQVLEKVPKIVVDMGAVPYVCKGADVMAPGIVRIEGEFGKGDIVVVVDEKHGKLLGLGESLLDSVSARAAKQGAVVKNRHFVSDKIWNLTKTLVN